MNILKPKWKFITLIDSIISIRLFIFLFFKIILKALIIHFIKIMIIIIN